MTTPSPTARLEDGWRRFWFAEIPPHSYAVLRILTGIVGLATLVGAWNPAFWDVDGIVPLSGAWGLGPWLLAHGLGHIAGRLLRDLLVIAYACMAVGIFTPVTVPLVFLGSTGMLSWNFLPYSGAQQLLHEVPFCLIFVDSGAVWSVDAWSRNRKGSVGPPRLEPTWPLRTSSSRVWPGVPFGPVGPDISSWPIFSARVILPISESTWPEMASRPRRAAGAAAAFGAAGLALAAGSESSAAAVTSAVNPVEIRIAPSRRRGPRIVAVLPSAAGQPAVPCRQPTRPAC